MLVKEPKHDGLERVLRGVAAIPVEAGASLGFRLAAMMIFVLIGSVMVATMAFEMADLYQDGWTGAWIAMWAVLLMSAIVFAKAATEILYIFKAKLQQNSLFPAKPKVHRLSEV